LFVNLINFPSDKLFISFLCLGKFRPNFGLCLSGSMDETVLSSLSKPPATPPSKSQKQPQSSKTPSHDTDPLSTPKVRQSGKNLLSFRTQTPTNVNPIVAFSNDPSIQLTSYRKVDQDSTPTLSSTDSTNTSLFPYQSDSDITHSSNSSRLQKHPSRYSLPDVPLQRSNSASAAKMNSPIIPQFLCTTSDKNDDVFTTNEQEKAVAASTFGDSSMKSKVLQASFRGKASTMDRRTTTPLRIQATTTASINNHKRNLNTQPKYFTTKTDDKPSNGPVNHSLDSVLNLTLQLEQTSTADYQRRHTISTSDIDPLLLNGLTDHENTLNLMEKTNGHHSPMITDGDQSLEMEEKDDNSSEHDRIQTNSSINNQTIE
jgi:hypothetical protein